MSTKIFCFVIAILMTCTTLPLSKKVPATFSYKSIKNLRIVFASPVVVSSEIFYDNRYTNQNYHSIDRGRTKDVFLQEFLRQIKQEKCTWRICQDQIDKLITEEFSAKTAPVSKLPERVFEALRNDSVDVIMVLYGMHFYHEQSVGSRQKGHETVNAYGTKIDKKLEYFCSMFDLKDNTSIVTIPVSNKQNGQAFNIVEISIKNLFAEIMR